MNPRSRLIEILKRGLALALALAILVALLVFSLLAFAVAATAALALFAYVWWKARANRSAIARREGDAPEP